VTDSAKKIDGWEGVDVPVWNTDEVKSARSSVVALSWTEALLTGAVAITIFLSSCCFCSDDK
jgi:hypothetical protein